MRARILGAVDRRVARYILGWLLLLLAPAATKHLVEEAKLRPDGAGEGEQYKGKEAHRGSQVEKAAQGTMESNLDLWLK